MGDGEGDGERSWFHSDVTLVLYFEIARPASPLDVRLAQKPLAATGWDVPYLVSNSPGLLGTYTWGIVLNAVVRGTLKSE